MPWASPSFSRAVAEADPPPLDCHAAPAGKLSHQDGGGNWIVHPNEFVVFDSTQKNANGELCKWNNPPQWRVEDPQEALNVKSSSNPFLLRVQVLRRATFRVSASIDGVDSNELVIDSRAR